MKVQFTAEAGDQILQILAWLGERSPAAAASVSARIETLASILRDTPHLGQRRYGSDVRAVPLGNHPYRLFYLIENDEVVILSVRHTSRRPPRDSHLK